MHASMIAMNVVLYYMHCTNDDEIIDEYYALPRGWINKNTWSVDWDCFSGIRSFSQIPSDIWRSDFSRYQIHFWDDSDTRR